jgi:hypothetical protein
MPLAWPRSASGIISRANKSLPVPTTPTHQRVFFRPRQRAIFFRIAASTAGHVAASAAHFCPRAREQLLRRVCAFRRCVHHREDARLEGSRQRRPRGNERVNFGVVYPRF